MTGDFVFDRDGAAYEAHKATHASYVVLVAVTSPFWDPDDTSRVGITRREGHKESARILPLHSHLDFICI